MNDKIFYCMLPVITAVLGILQILSSIKNDETYPKTFVIVCWVLIAIVWCVSFSVSNIVKKK